MKMMVIIGLIQTLVLIALLWRTETLASRVNQLAEQLSSEISRNTQIKQTPAPPIGELSSGVESLQQQLVLDQIRISMREELQSALGTSPIAENHQNSDIATQEIVPAADESKLAEIESQIAYLLSDGQFTQADLNSVENELIALNATDRRRILNKMTQSMMAAGVPLSQ